MKKSLAALALVLGFGFAVVAEEKKSDLTADKLAGEWSFVSGKKMGEAIEKDRLNTKTTWTKDTITIPAGPDQKFVMKFTLDTSKTPATIDMEIKEGPVNEGKAIGIIELKGDELKLCYVPLMGADEKRPTKFESTEDYKTFLFVMKKAK